MCIVVIVGCVCPMCDVVIVGSVCAMCNVVIVGSLQVHVLVGLGNAGQDREVWDERRGPAGAGEQPHRVAQRHLSG